MKHLSNSNLLIGMRQSNASTQPCEWACFWWWNNSVVAKLSCRWHLSEILRHCCLLSLVMGDIPVHTILNDINTNDNEYHLLQWIPKYRYYGIWAITAALAHVRTICTFTEFYSIWRVIWKKLYWLKSQMPRV